MKFKASHTKVGNSSFCICLFLQSSCWTNTSTANHDGRIARQVCTVFCSAILVCLLLTCSTPGQTVVDAQQSLPPYGSFSGSNFDIVSLQNGNLHISIPVVSAKQRGTPITINYVFDTLGFTKNLTVQTLPNGTFFYSYSVGFDSSFPGWRLINPRGTWGISMAPTTITCASQSVSAYSNFTVTDPEGVKHPLFLINSSIPSCSTAPASPTYDGSGALVNVTFSYPNLSSAQITFQDGSRANLQSSSPTVEDSNGNITGTLVDDLNRTLLTVSDAASTTYTSPLGKTGSGPAYTLWSFADSNGTQQTFRIDYTLIDLQTSFCSTTPNGTDRSCTDIAGVKLVPQKLTLPTSASYQFAWFNASAGEMQQITLPTGGSISYGNYFNNCPNPPINRAATTTSSGCRRAVGQRTVTVNGVSSTWSYNYSGGTTVTDPLGNDEVHMFAVVTSNNVSSANSVETQVKYYSGSSTSGTGTVLRTINKDYTGEPAPGSSLPQHLANIRLIRETTTLDNGLVRKTETDYAVVTYGANGANATVTPHIPSEIREYDYGSGAPGPLIRRTDYAYLYTSNSTYLNLNLLDRPTSIITHDGSGNIVSQTQNEYDNYTAGIQASGAVQHDSALNTSYLTRGNVTAVKRWRSTDGAWLTTRNQYDDAGNVLSTTDPNGNQTTFSYADSWAIATCAPSSGNAASFVTSITNALSQVSHATFNSCTGTVASSTDPNTQKTSYSYDNMQRPVSVNYPDGGQTSFSYNDSALPSVATTKKITGSLNLAKTVNFDGLGRASQSALTSDPDGTTYNVETYDALGRTASVSNPYRSTTERTYGITSYVYDALGRTCVVVPPDGTLPSGNACPATQPSNTVLTTYSGNTVTVTDQAGKSRKSVSDGLGRLTQVFEDSAGLNYETDYTYDALDNLLTVNQKGGTTDSSQWRTRTFIYDSLSRLLTATNPESGAISYTYDANGNLIYKTSPAPNQTGTATVTLTYCYDALNRLTAKAYTQQTCTNGTVPSPVAAYLYDQSSYNGLTITNGIGHRTGITDQAGSEAWSYDTMGRVLADQRTTNGVKFNTPYTYNLDGSIATVTYPHLQYPLTVTFQPGGAGRPVLETSNDATYASNVHYAPNGSLCYFQQGWGTTTTTNWTFNNRFQPARIYESAYPETPPTPCTTPTQNSNLPMDFTYSYADANGHNNGNVAQIANNGDNGADWSRSQMFTYDSLNRIATAKTWGTPVNPGVQSCWAEQYGYDPWGNLLSISGISPQYNGCIQESGLSVAVNTKNQIIGNTYDSAGNMIIAQPGNVQYVYDAENHLTATAGQTYFYDGDGKRVEKATTGPPLAANKLYWYGQESNAFAETDAVGNELYRYFRFGGLLVAREEANDWVDHYGVDALGNVRWLYSNGGGWDTSDYYPFGGERVVQSASNNTRKFTGKERDSESGNDNFGARYYSSSLGRFMSPDPLAGHTEDPQTLNRYVYVRNNPLNLTDPTGLDFYLSCQKASNTCQKDAAGNLVQGQYVTDASGNKSFQSTVVTSASLQDPKSGNTATVNENGVQITTGNGTAQGIFINGTDAANIQGSGKLSDFVFRIDSSDEKKGTLDAGSYTYEGSRNQPDIVKALTERGAFQYTAEKVFGNPFHEGDLNFRFSSGAHPNLFDYGPSPHLLVPQDPKATVPVGPGYVGNFHVDSHTGSGRHGACAIAGVGCQ